MNADSYLAQLYWPMKLSEIRKICPSCHLSTQTSISLYVILISCCQTYFLNKMLAFFPWTRSSTKMQIIKITVQERPRGSRVLAVYSERDCTLERLRGRVVLSCQKIFSLLVSSAAMGMKNSLFYLWSDDILKFY